ncbi:MAG: histidine phosphatase family protein [Thermodesulfobacteriota bacterium]
MGTTIALARHGVTAANRRDVFAGRTDEGLLPEGIAQLEAVAGALRQAGGIDAIYCGPLVRTRQSAEVVARLLGVPVSQKEALNEIRIPHWDGLTKQQLRERFGQEYPTWLADPAGFAVVGCETIAAVQRRAVSCLEEIFSVHPGGRVLVVSHLIVVRSLLLHYMGKAIDEFRAIKVANGQVALLERGEDGEVTVRLEAAAG